MQMLYKPIFIFGSQKSGSSLLRSLLDSHPSLFVVPSESHYFQLTGHCVDFSMRRAEYRSMNLDQKTEALIRYIQYENVNYDLHGAVVIGNRYDESVFEKFLKENARNDDRTLMAAYLNAFHNALHGYDVPDGIRIVEKSIEHAEFAPLLLKYFPDAKFIHIIRNPYATLVSTRNTNWQGGYPYLGSYLASLRNSYCRLFQNLALFENYYVVRYEDLVSNPQSVMQGIAAYLGIEMHEILVQPTLFGRPWVGNSSSNRKFAGVSADPSEKWRDSICDIEIVLTNRVARAVFEYFDYEMLSPRHHPWRQRFERMRGESIKRYFRNRALLLTMSPANRSRNAWSRDG